MATGKDIVTEAINHLGEEYILGADVPFENSDYKGPWDCAEFCSWVVYRASGLVLGCVDNSKSIKKLEPYSGGWYRDGMQAMHKITYEEAKKTPGAVFVRKPTDEKRGHVAFSQGNGKTIQAFSSRYDVTEKSPDNRTWHVCFLIDGIDYS